MVQLDNVIYDHNLSSTQSSVFQLETMNELKEFIIQLGTKRINLPSSGTSFGNLATF